MTVETVGQRLRRLRLNAGLSQRELAEPGVSYAYISRIEAGTRKPSVKALRKVARKLGVTPEYLETGDDRIVVRIDRGVAERLLERLMLAQRPHTDDPLPNDLADLEEALAAALPSGVTSSVPQDDDGGAT